MTDKPMITDWEEMYQNQEVESMPWYRPDLDQDFEQILKDLDLSSGTALDIGTGPGTQAFALAERGFEVTATDISKAAIKKAQSAAESKGLKIEFLVDDILNTRLDKQFDLILDRGCFHLMHFEQREAYIDTLFNLLKSGGILLLKTFSYKESSPGGPYRFDPVELKEYFSKQFYVNMIRESVFDGVNEKPRAMTCLIQKP